MTELVTHFAGGLGLLLIGMSLMTDGLRLASGNALRAILARWTNSRLRGLFSGFLVTGIVQSSSAVTVATIGFVNAGLLTLERAIWVIYGSNVGTTMTAWLVALLGFSLDIEAFALPLVGFGMLLRLVGRNSRLSSLGLAILGFGLLFLGISFLKTAFENVGTRFTLPVADTLNLLWIAVYVLSGFVLTTLMQSSSAAMVIALSAAQGGLVPLHAAAAVVIGANLGTTTTALLAIIGATASAKRVAVSHLTFNLITALVAMFIVGPMLTLVGMLEDGMNIQPTAAVTLAIFHTIFNILGVLLMWPLSHRMTGWLQRRFTGGKRAGVRPRHLDRTVLPLPFLATDALSLEVTRINHHAIETLRRTLARRSASDVENEARIARTLSAEVGKFAAELNRSELTEFLSNQIASLLECTQQYLLVLDIADDITLLRDNFGNDLPPQVSDAMTHFHDGIMQHLTGNDLSVQPLAALDQDSYAEVERRYRELKNRILGEAAHGHLSMDETDRLLQFANQAKRACRQIMKASHRLQQVRQRMQGPPAPVPAELPAETTPTA